MTDDKRLREKIYEITKAVPGAGDLINRLPEAFFELSDTDDIIHDLKHLPAIISNGRKAYNYHSDIEEFAIMGWGRDRLLHRLNRFYLHNIHNTKLFRIYFDKQKQFVIAGSYYLLGGSERTNERSLREPRWDEIELFKTTGAYRRRIVFHEYLSEQKELGAEVANVSFVTVIKNFLETLGRFECSFIEIWMNNNYSARARNLYSLRFRFHEPLKERDVAILESEVIHYLSPFIRARSIFSIIGPVMVGPSSSHTAGAARIGNIARHIILSLIESGNVREVSTIGIGLRGSFRETGAGHSTPEAILGGLNGLSPDDPDLLRIGREFMKGTGKKKFEIGARSVPFGGFLPKDTNVDERYSKEVNRNIAEIEAGTGRGKLSMTGFSIGGGEVELRYINGRRLSRPIDGKSEFVLDGNMFPGMNEPFRKVTISPLEGAPKKRGKEHEYVLDFNTFEELLEIFGGDIRGNRLRDEIMKVEENISGLTGRESLEKARDIWKVMSGSISSGRTSEEPIMFDRCGRDSRMVGDFGPGDTLFGRNLYTLALEYSLAVIEENARHSLIVACPTAGACGILPAVLKAWDDLAQGGPDRKQEKIIGALMASGFLGMILYDVVPTAGATYGCQAEIGAGAAMAASALTYVLDGNLEQMVGAFTLAMKNSMGLTCDPVSGLVAVPCIKRNGIFTSAAISSSLMALSGVRSVISPDEVVLAVKEVGEKMNDDFKETARGGLAVTRDARKIDRMMDEYRERTYGPQGFRSGDP